MTDLPDVLSALIVQPGDVLVIAVPSTTTAEQVNDARSWLVEHWPQLVDRVMVVAGATNLAVIRTGDRVDS